jgi:hypothetical protein
MRRRMLASRQNLMLPRPLMPNAPAVRGNKERERGEHLHVIVVMRRRMPNAPAAAVQGNKPHAVRARKKIIFMSTCATACVAACSAPVVCGPRTRTRKEKNPGAVRTGWKLDRGRGEGGGGGRWGGGLKAACLCFGGWAVWMTVS